MANLEGVPDGATLDAADGLWCALFGGGRLARFATSGLDRTIDVPVANPADVTFGGPDLDRLYVVTVPFGPDVAALDGALLVVDDLGVRGRLEPRFVAV
jgi:L-arabinonolactonase